MTITERSLFRILGKKEDSEVRIRCDSLLARAEQQTAADIRTMFAEHSAKGLLGSGAAIIRATQILSRNVSSALQQMQDEVGKRVEHRGRAWSAANQAVLSSLQDFEARSEQIFDPVWRISRAPDSAVRAGNDRIAEAFADAKAQVQEFFDGWTAPRPRHWHERNPFKYAALMLALGSIITVVIQGVLENLADFEIQHEIGPQP